MIRLTVAFFKLIRWPNLFFIAVTQFLFYYCILVPCFHYSDLFSADPILQERVFWMLSLSSVLIAAAGYIINDYFDLNIDRVNRPDRMVIDKVIKRRYTILWHWILSGAGVVLGFYVSMKVHNLWVGLSNLGCVILLWFYSTTFKRKLLIGNVIISLLTAWVILVLYICEFRIALFQDADYHRILTRLFKFAILYAGFAFIISMIREVIKDIEDLDGDARYGCRTMPIVWGVNTAKVFAATWLTVLMGAVVVILFYVSQYRRWMVIAYGMLMVVFPLFWILRKLYSARTSEDYHFLSSMVKTVMLTGILSMIILDIV